MSKKQLIVDIDRESVRFSRLNGVTVEEQFHFDFKDKSDFGYSNQLDVFLVKTDFRSQNWDEYSLSWFSEKSTLLPYSIFNDTDFVKTFHLAYGNSVAPNCIEYNRIPEYSCANIYEIPLWVKSFFSSRFPRMVMEHEGSHAIRGLISGASAEFNLMITLHENHFLILATQKNELKFYSTFEYQTAEDIVYHTAHILQQNNWQEEKGTLRLVASLISSKDKVQKAKDIIGKLPPFQHLKIEESEHLLSQFQILCV